jgi:hypothetical protein
MRLLKIIVAILCIIGFSITLNLSKVFAQVRDTSWSAPYRLSTEGRKTSEGYLANDQYGFVHVFWSEELPDNRSIIQYSRFNGEFWSEPIDMRVTPPFRAIGNTSPIVDHSGILHLLWVEGFAGPAFYSSSPLNQATSAQNWPDPIRIDIPANRAKLQVDSQGTLHVIYSYNQSPGQGLYYLRSEDQGLTWTDPHWLDPDILPNHIPSSFQFQLDESDGIHLVWSYVATMGSGGDWVRYIHSKDRGETWSDRKTIDKNDQGSPGLNSFAYPLLAVKDREVHIVWAAGDLLYRHHRYSTDGGMTWSDPVQFMGNLNGQAFDGMTLDAIGRLHLISQIRYPQGIYHSIWDGAHWSSPLMIYFITSSASELIPNSRIHAHATFPIFRAGNKLVITFTDSPPEPERGLYVMVRTLSDVPSSLIKPTLVPTETPLPLGNSNLSPSPIATQLPVDPLIRVNDPNQTPLVPLPIQDFWLAVIPPFLLIGFLFAYRLFTRFKN